MIQIKVMKLNENTPSLPALASAGSAGADLRACIPEEGRRYIPAGGREIIPLGFATSFPQGYEIQVRPRSGLAIKYGITVLNSPGTIDSDFRDEWGVILHNAGNMPFEIKHGDRIAQAVLCKLPEAEYVEVDEICMKDDRGGGFGHSGVK